MSNWPFLNKHRRFIPGYPVIDDSAGFNGAFVFPVAGEARAVCVIASDGGGWQHCSVSFGKESKRCPSWEVMCAVKELFWEPEDAVIQIHPPKADYVNFHQGCLHLWRCTHEKQPLPPWIFVGPKKVCA